MIMPCNTLKIIQFNQKTIKIQHISQLEVQFNQLFQILIIQLNQIVSQLYLILKIVETIFYKICSLILTCKFWKSQNKVPFLKRYPMILQSTKANNQQYNRYIACLLLIQLSIQTKKFRNNCKYQKIYTKIVQNQNKRVVILQKQQKLCQNKRLQIYLNTTLIEILNQQNTIQNLTQNKIKIRCNYIIIKYCNQRYKKLKLRSISLIFHFQSKIVKAKLTYKTLKNHMTNFQENFKIQKMQQLNQIQYKKSRYWNSIRMMWRINYNNKLNAMNKYRIQKVIAKIKQIITLKLKNTNNFSYKMNKIYRLNKLQTMKNNKIYQMILKNINKIFKQFFQKISLLPFNQNLSQMK
ncbi:hypothetical protein TTHERM_000312679 (macronuclear) [Tetrahymena thermophila SB210]|uniref:Uncharacterized protein n=1 Tax=Tetrahymena thermophila (strain SB210) TaxID=312017 RepID=W7XE78_TETTS|nr:hypothetical protein TTHERM_000312679 [Tetrahymena thermophila SB210]EWS72246.1 hypothetical protein TTHERM_000312679 [Tetrahymena thermophila SB210]|eukprot:XP_012655186.1 hypothetical protein TTHERM_000312679 [Tetrahymena thermophila SB210]